jgi:murein DD-endopeptidase MepM/ murein hydrolase activator NlpD
MAPLKILNKTMSILVRSTIMLGRGISKLTFGIWRIVKWTAGLPFRLLFSTVKTLTKVVTSIPNAFMSATTSIFNKMTNFMKKGGFSGAAKRFGGTMKTLFIGADKQPESEVLAGDTGAATITEINKKEKKKKGLEGELQKIRHSITEFHGSVSKDWAKDTEISKKQSETVKKSWKGMIEQFKTSRDGMKNQLNTLKESYKTFKEQKNLQKKIKNATEGTESKLGLGQSALKKAFSSIGTWLMIGVTLLKSAFGNIIGMVKGLLSKIPFLKKLFPNLGGPGGVGGSKGGLFSKAKKSGKFKYGGTGVKAGGIAGLGMGAGMSTLGGGIAGVMSGIEVGKERGMASGIAQGAISGSLSTIGGLLLGPIGTVLGKMLGDAIGKAAFGLGDWMAKHFNIFEIVDKYILSPIQNIFRTIGNVITDIKNGIVSAITSVLPDWAKKLIGITDTKPQSEGDKIREQMKRDPEAAFKEAQFQAAKRSKINREAGGDAGMKWARGYESGGVVPKAPNGGVDGRGGQLALVHEGEKIIPKSVVESSRLNGGPTKDLKMGSSKPGNIVDNILSGLKEMVTPESLDLIKGMGNNISNFGSNIFGKLKIGFENLKENLGPKSGFGWLSRMFESAGAGPAAIGWDSTGGKSYGYYQLAEKRGTPKKFLEQFPKIGQQFTGLQIGSEQFDAKWRELAKSDPSFAQAQHDFIKQQYLNPYLAKIKAATGIDLSTKHSAVLEEILSTAVQYGPNSGVIPKALSGLTQTAKDEEIIKKIGEYKFANVGEHFRSSTSAVQQAVANRISRETSAALQALGISNTEMTAPSGSQPGKTSMFGRLTNFASGIAEKVYSSFKGALGMPANSGLVTSEFGPRNTGLSGASTIHKGIDLRARQGEPVYSIQDGIVTDINNKWGQVSIKHPNGFESSYAHLSEYGVQPGTKIGKGQKIGAAGKTGPIPGMAAHLHMSVKDPTGNYVNPRKLFENAGINLASKDGAKSKEMGSPGPELSKKDVARMQADKDTSMANLLNESSKGFQDAALNSMNQNGKQTAMIVNSMSNNISSSMNSLAKSVAAGGSGGGNNQGNNDISAILSGDMA